MRQTYIVTFQNARPHRRGVLLSRNGHMATMSLMTRDWQENGQEVIDLTRTPHMTFGKIDDVTEFLNGR